MGLYDIIILAEPILFKYFEKVKEVQTKYYSIYTNGELYLKGHTSINPNIETNDIFEFIKNGWLELYFKVVKVRGLKIEPFLYEYKPKISPVGLVYSREDIVFLAKPSYFYLEVEFYDKKGKRYIARTREFAPFDRIYDIEKELMSKIKSIIK